MVRMAGIWKRGVKLKAVRLRQTEWVAENGGQVEGLDAGRDGWGDEEKGKVKDANPRAARKVAPPARTLNRIDTWAVLYKGGLLSACLLTSLLPLAQ